jgi:hypothetical protein
MLIVGAYIKLKGSRISTADITLRDLPLTASPTMEAGGHGKMTLATGTP